MEGYGRWYNEICFIPIFNFPDVETVASQFPCRVCLALSPPVGNNKGEHAVNITR